MIIAVIKRSYGFQSATLRWVSKYLVLMGQSIRLDKQIPEFRKGVRSRVAIIAEEPGFKLSSSVLELLEVNPKEQSTP